LAWRRNLVRLRGNILAQRRLDIRFFGSMRFDLAAATRSCPPVQPGALGSLRLPVAFFAHVWGETGLLSQGGIRVVGNGLNQVRDAGLSTGPAATARGLALTLPMLA
jgi:hypothetical protein